MHSLTCPPLSSCSHHTILKPNLNSLLGADATSRPCSLPLKRRTCFTTRAILSSTREDVLKHFNERRALKIISGLQNFNKSVVTAADKGGATHVDIACDPKLVKLAIGLISCPVCVSSVDPATFPAVVEAGALMVEIGNYDSFYEKGVIFTPEKMSNKGVEEDAFICGLVKLAESLEQEGIDIIQTEEGKCSNPTKSGAMGLIEKATPTLAAAYSISRAVKIPVMCSSGLSAVTAPMAITAGAAGVGVGSAVNRLNDVVAMIAEVRSIANSLQTPFQISTTHEVETQRQ